MSFDSGWVISGQPIFAYKACTHCNDITANHWQLNCMSNSSFSLIPKENLKLHMTGPLWGEPTSGESTITITPLPYTHKGPVMWKAVPYHVDIMMRLLCNIIWYWTKIEIEQDTFSTASFLWIHLLILTISISSWWYIRRNILHCKENRKNIDRSDVKVTFELYGHFRCLQVLYSKWNYTY